LVLRDKKSEFVRQKLIIPAIFLLGFGISQLLVFFVGRIAKSPIKPVKISQEATSTAVFAGISSSAVVARVIDGDTIELANGKKVRYIGIDAPELVHPQKPVECFAQEAKKANQQLVEEKQVRLEKDISETDQYDRLLRYVYVNGTMVNDYLVRQGFAHTLTFPPDVAFANQLREAEQEARENNRGLWGGCQQNPTNPINPSTSLTTSPINE